MGKVSFSRPDDTWNGHHSRGPGSRFCLLLPPTVAVLHAVSIGVRCGLCPIGPRGVFAARGAEEVFLRVATCIHLSIILMAEGHAATQKRAGSPGQTNRVHNPRSYAVDTMWAQQQVRCLSWHRLHGFHVLRPIASMQASGYRDAIAESRRPCRAIIRSRPPDAEPHPARSAIFCTFSCSVRLPSASMRFVKVQPTIATWTRKRSSAAFVSSRISAFASKTM